MDITEKLDRILEAYYGKPKWKKQKEGQVKAKWMSDVLDDVKKTIPDIEAPTPQSFWDTAAHFFNQGMTTQEAAKRLKKSFKK
jgi:hypothetical protein